MSYQKSLLLFFTILISFSSSATVSNWKFAHLGVAFDNKSWSVYSLKQFNGKNIFESIADPKTHIYFSEESHLASGNSFEESCKQLAKNFEEKTTQLKIKSTNWVNLKQTSACVVHYEKTTNNQVMIQYHFPKKIDKKESITTATVVMPQDSFTPKKEVELRAFFEGVTTL